MHWYKQWKTPVFSLSSRHSLYGSGVALFQQPSSQVKDAAVTWPGVSVESGPAQGGQRVQQAGGQSRQVVVVQLECGGVWREGRGQAGRGEAAFTTVHHTGRAGAHLRTPELSHGHLTAQHWQHQLQHEHNTPHASTHTADRPQLTIMFLLSLWAIHQSNACRCVQCQISAASMYGELNWINRDVYAYLGFQEEAKEARKTKIKKSMGWYKLIMVSMSRKNTYESNAYLGWNWIANLHQNCITS